MKFTLKTPNAFVVAGGVLLAAVIVQMNWPMIKAPIVSVNHTVSLPLFMLINMVAPGVKHFACNQMLQALPFSIIFFGLGIGCYSCKNHQRQVDEFKETGKEAEAYQAKQGALAAWFNSVRGEIGRICFMIGFVNIIGMFNQPIVGAIAGLALGNLIKDRITELTECWNWRSSPDPWERFTPGTFLIVSDELGRLDFIQMAEVGDKIITGYVVTDNYDPKAPEPEQLLVQYNIDRFAIYKKYRGTREKLQAKLQQLKG